MNDHRNVKKWFVAFDLTTCTGKSYTEKLFNKLKQRSLTFFDRLHENHIIHNNNVVFKIGSIIQIAKGQYNHSPKNRS